MRTQPEWVPAPSTDTQRQCRHPRKRRNKKRTTCLKCGARKGEGGWEHLTPEWFDWYMAGGRGFRPGEDRRKAPRFVMVDVEEDGMP